jgi:hypothetical protein
LRCKVQKPSLKNAGFSAPFTDDMQHNQSANHILGSSMETQLFVHDRQVATTIVAQEIVHALCSSFGIAGYAPSSDIGLARTFLLDLRKSEFWLACGCRGADRYPLMSPRLVRGGVTICRHGSIEHSAECPFFQDELNRVTSTGEHRERGPAPWLILANDADHPNRAIRESRETYHRHLPLADLLLTTLDRAGYTTVLPGDVVTRRDRKATSARKDSYAGLDRFNDEGVGGDLYWKDVGCTFLPAMHRHMKHLSTLTQRFGSGARPQGIFLGIVHEICSLPAGRAQLLWSGGKDGRTCIVEVESAVRPVGRSATATGPYWVLGQIAQPHGQTSFSVVNACFFPCLSRSVLLPVETNAQRQTAEVLLSQMTYWAKTDSLNVQVHLHKPLFDEAIDSVAGSQPDFVLWLPRGDRLMIMTVEPGESVQARDAREECQRRLRILPQVAAVIEHHVDDPIRMEFARLLTRLVAKHR